MITFGKEYDTYTRISNAAGAGGVGFVAVPNAKTNGGNHKYNTIEAKMGWYTDMHNELTARQIIETIANEYIELSHDKVHLQRDDIVKRCKEWLKANPEEVQDEQP